MVEEIKAKMPSKREIEDVSNLFKVLGDPTRAKILFSIEDNELNVTDICNCVDMNKSAVSSQLRILRDAKLVKARRDGKEVFYSLDDEHVTIIFKYAREHINE
ncbi:MAG: metalloregulator ArsR/SmtB family transcription factor [Acholeplasmatales bacterium]|nr:metalloregulator ArsR/SmtB family transcription factor [Acholeplasmatales bacterium]